jgi:uncharacterized membrane protein YjjP (DUF1212 family)
MWSATVDGTNTASALPSLSAFLAATVAESAANFIVLSFVVSIFAAATAAVAAAGVASVPASLRWEGGFIGGAAMPVLPALPLLEQVRITGLGCHLGIGVDSRRRW